MTRILIIDDEEGMRGIVSSILENAGFDTLVAESADAGWTALKTSHPDIVVSDVRMEGRSGFDLLEQVRADPETSDIPFIFITGVGGQHTYRRGMELGADDFLEKPFTKDQLLASVKTRLKLHQIQKEAGEKRLQELRSSISHALPHEFRTPLNAILAFSQILRDDATVTPDEVRKYSGLVHAAGERLHRLVENHLLYAQLDLLVSDEKALADLRNQETEQINLIIQSAAHDVAEKYKRTRDLSMKLEPAAAKVSYDHMARVATEIVDNALKFSEPGTPVTLEGSVTADGYVLIVRDLGKGMTRQQAESIGAFQQFERHSREQAGTGLGLSIVRKLVQVYGGSFAVESSPGKGSAIRLVWGIASPQ